MLLLLGAGAVPSDSSLLIQASIVVLGDPTTQGQVVQGVTIAWEAILKSIDEDPDFIHRLPWRKTEELIAAAYKKEGWPDVVLAPPSGDKGRDIIVTKPGFGSIRFYDQVKAYSRGFRVTANDVRALAGVLLRDQNVSKGIITTTSDFATCVKDEFKDLIPYRLELKNGEQLQEWLADVARMKKE